MNWRHVSYAFIAACLDYKTLSTEVAPCLHPDVHDALRFLVAVIQKYKSFPTDAHFQQRFNVNLAQYRLQGYTVKEVGDLVRRFYKEDTVQQLTADLQASVTTDGVDIEYLNDALRKFRKDIDQANDAKIWRLSDFSKVINTFAKGSPAVARYGFPRMDYLSGGIFPGQYIIVYANTTEGKSTIARAIAANMAVDGKKILYISLEEPGDRSIIKAATTLLHFSSRDVLQGKVDPRLLQAELQLPGDIIFIDDMKHRNTEALLSLAERYKPDVIFLDQIPLFTKNFDQDWKVMAQVSRDLKYFAHLNHIPVIALTQATRKSKSAKLDEMGFAYAISQDADVAIYIHPTDPDFKMQKKITFVKMRDGERNVDVDFFIDHNNGLLREEEYHANEPGALVASLAQTSTPVQPLQRGI